jgi:hypothetical protein
MSEPKSILKRAGEEGEEGASPTADASTAGEETDSLTASNTDQNRGAGRKKRSVKKSKTAQTPSQQQFERMLRSNAKMLRFVLKVQERLLGPAVSADSLARAAQILRPDAFEEVVLERANEGLCGWPCCAAPLDPNANKLQKYRISRAEQRVYDTTEGAHFCSQDCLMASGRMRLLS